MRHRFLWSLSVALLATAVALPPGASAQTRPLSSQENDEGQVMVTVTPLDLSKAGDSWRFEVQLHTHVAPVTQDMTAVATLSDGRGHSEQPSAWEILRVGITARVYWYSNRSVPCRTRSQSISARWEPFPSVRLPGTWAAHDCRRRVCGWTDRHRN